MNKNFIVYFRLRPRNRNTDQYNKSLAHHVTIWTDETKNHVKRTSISLFLNRMWYSYQNKSRREPAWDWDTFFAEVVSHEYLHKVLVDSGLYLESETLDRLYGTMSREPYSMAGCGLTTRPIKVIV